MWGIGEKEESVPSERFEHERLQKHPKIPEKSPWSMHVLQVENEKHKGNITIVCKSLNAPKIEYSFSRALEHV